MKIISTGISPDQRSTLSTEDEKSAVDIRLEETRLLATWLYQKTSHTRQAYESDVKKFLAFFPNLSIKEVTTAHIGVFLKENNNLKESSLARTKSALSSLFKFLVRVGYLEKNPADSLDPIKVPDQTQFRVLSHEEIKRMIDLEPNRRNQILMRLFYKTGIRVSEACGLKFSNIRERDGNYFLVLVGKGNKTRTIGIDEGTFSELEELRMNEGSRVGLDIPIFRAKKSATKGISPHSVRKMVTNAAKRAKVSDKATPHWFRHSHATKALEMGEDLRVIQHTLGHDSIVTTTKYTKVFPGKNSGEKIDI